MPIHSGLDNQVLTAIAAASVVASSYDCLPDLVTINGTSQMRRNSTVWKVAPVAALLGVNLCLVSACSRPSPQLRSTVMVAEARVDAGMVAAASVDDGFIEDGALSPDGTHILMSADKNSGGYQIYLCQPSGSSQTINPRKLQFAQPSYKVGWVSSELIILAHNWDVTAMEYESGKVRWKLNIDPLQVQYLKVSDWAVFDEGTKIIASTYNEPYDLGTYGRVLCFDATNGTLLAVIHEKRREITTVTVNDTGTFIGVIDNDRVCDVFVKSVGAGEQVFPYRGRRVDDLLFGSNVAKAQRHGVVAVSKVGERGVYWADGSVYIFEIRRHLDKTQDPVSSTKLAGSDGQWSANVLATFAVPALSDQNERWCFWDGDNILYLYNGPNMWRIFFQDRKWRLAKGPPLGFVPVALTGTVGDRFVAWGRHRVGVYSKSEMPFETIE